MALLLNAVAEELPEHLLRKGALVKACDEFARFALLNSCVLVALEGIKDSEHECAQVLDGGTLELLPIDGVL